MHSAYSQHTGSFILPIIRICKDSFCIIISRRTVSFHIFLLTYSEDAKYWGNSAFYLYCAVSFLVFLVYEQFHSVYSRFMKISICLSSNFILRIIRKHQVFSEIKQKLCVFSTYTKFHSTYYQYTLNFIPHIISIHEISFCIFNEYVPVEARTARGTTALVYCLINSSLYTGTVHRWWSTSNWPNGQ